VWARLLRRLALLLLRRLAEVLERRLRTRVAYLGVISAKSRRNLDIISV